jgi:hypothetical protein
MSVHTHCVWVNTIDEYSVGDLTEPDIDPSNTKALFKEALTTAIAEARNEMQSSSLLRDMLLPLPDVQSGMEIPVPSATMRLIHSSGEQTGGHLGYNPDGVFPSPPLKTLDALSFITEWDMQIFRRMKECFSMQGNPCIQPHHPLVKPCEFSKV